MTGVFGALSVALAVTPFGYIVIPGTPLAVTIMHIPVIIVTLLSGLVPGLAVGFIFGLTSMIRTIMMGSLFFYNPLVSVLPRMLFPLAVWLICGLLMKIPRMPRLIANAVAAGLGTLTHTLLVLGAIYLIYFKEYIPAGQIQDAGRTFSGFFTVIAGVLLSNGIWEIIAAVAIAFIFFSAVYLSSKRGSKLSRLEKEEAEE